MPKYEVTTACHVPVGSGFKHKRPGQVVTLTKTQANKLSDYLKPLDDDDEGVAKRNTPSKSEGGVAKRNTPEPEPKSDPPPVLETETVREVYSDGGESTPGDA